MSLYFKYYRYVFTFLVFVFFFNFSLCNDDFLFQLSESVVYVSNTGNDGNSGTISSPVETIKQAYELANQNDSNTIILFPGTYTGTENYLTFDSDIFIKSLHPTEETIIQGHYHSNCFTFLRQAIISGITFKECLTEGILTYSNTLANNCSFVDSSAGILIGNHSTIVEIKDCYFDSNVYDVSLKFNNNPKGKLGLISIKDSHFQNWSTQSIFMYSVYSLLSITNSTFTNSIRTAVYVYDCQDIIIETTTISDIKFDAPISVTSANITIDHSIIENSIQAINFSKGNMNIISSRFKNIVKNSGNSGISASHSVITITSSSFSDNHSNNGGSISVNNAVLNIDNSSFKNSSSTAGGAIYGYDSIINVNNTLFYDNTASNGGVGYLYNSTLNMSNSVMKDNQALLAGSDFYCFKSNTTLEHSYQKSNSSISLNYGCNI